MVSARVNGKPASVAHVLSDADVVEVRRYPGDPHTMSDRDTPGALLPLRPVPCHCKQLLLVARR